VLHLHAAHRRIRGKDRRIAVAELRPPIGSYVVLGSFAPTGALRIVDLGVLGDPFDYEDMFSSRFEEVSTRLAFLAILEQEMSLPVQPLDQELEYINNSTCRRVRPRGSGSRWRRLSIGAGRRSAVPRSSR
jgi:hypothetical protein